MYGGAKVEDDDWSIIEERYEAEVARLEPSSPMSTGHQPEATSAKQTGAAVAAGATAMAKQGLSSDSDTYLKLEFERREKEHREEMERRIQQQVCWCVHACVIDPS
jgi:hypothetical protein